MIVETARLVKSDEEGGLLPLGAGAKGLVGVFDQGHAIGDEALGVHGVCADAAAGGADDGEFGEGAGFAVRFEVGEGHDEVVVAGGVGPGEPEGVLFVAVVGVVLPGVVGFGEGLEDGALGHGAFVEVVGAFARRCS